MTTLTTTAIATATKNAIASDTDITPVSKTRRHIVMGVLASAVLLVGGLYATQWWRVGRFIEETDDAYVGGDVTVIAPRVSGYIVEMAVHDNQHVRQGDLLFRIDDRDFRAALTKAEGAVAAQEALILCRVPFGRHFATWDQPSSNHPCERSS